MGFQFLKTEIDGVYIIEPQVFGDERGYFYETYRKDVFDSVGLKCDFVQSNQSKSHKGVLRGLHFQTRKPQAKLVRVVSGTAYDVAVDLRKDSSTYGKYVGVILSEENHKMFFIPRGFAHGFVVLSETAVFEYQVDDIYDPDFESGIIWNDPDIGVDWPLKDDIGLSAKDKILPTLKEAKPIFGIKDGKCQLL